MYGVFGGGGGVNIHRFSEHMLIASEVTRLTRFVVHFSCGAASAVAAKLIVTDQARSKILIVNAFIREEHEDNRRFLVDVEQWLGCDIAVLRDDKYHASTFEVWNRKRFIKNRNGAPCSGILKRQVLAAVHQKGDITVIGYTSEERDRADRLESIFPNERFEFPLIDYGLSKADCLAMVSRAGIELPLMYRKGYDNANCIGCPKGGQSYWQAIREDFPDHFVQIKTLQEQIGPGANFLQFRSGPRKGERMALAELPEGRGNMAEDASFSCSFLCEDAERAIR